ncbi:uncharacterized protein LOC129790050 [Lutzomyia longipalpis]|uniref:uncharacterized protein LOC129790050 n=1 Tax=Lutzomyia longipalpis TaxID=7200 RepID=UPI00248381B1|nr:uncharacterized protein LOC129790050 [Lutzomyia longipalpis]XP_055683208.1 uncharacterized protein LOC129790050 [Lutzomyia longipalpis]
MAEEMNFRSQEEPFVQDPPSSSSRPLEYMLRGSGNSSLSREREELRRVVRSSGSQNIALSFVDDIIYSEDGSIEEVVAKEVTEGTPEGIDLQMGTAGTSEEPIIQENESTTEPTSILQDALIVYEKKTPENDVEIAERGALEKSLIHRSSRDTQLSLTYFSETDTPIDLGDTEQETSEELLKEGQTQLEPDTETTMDDALKSQEGSEPEILQEQEQNFAQGETSIAELTAEKSSKEGWEDEGLQEMEGRDAHNAEEEIANNLLQQSEMFSGEQSSEVHLINEDSTEELLENTIESEANEKESEAQDMQKDKHSDGQKNVQEELLSESQDIGEVSNYSPSAQMSVNPSVSSISPDVIPNQSGEAAEKWVPVAECFENLRRKKIQQGDTQSSVSPKDKEVYISKMLKILPLLRLQKGKENEFQTIKNRRLKDNSDDEITQAWDLLEKMVTRPRNVQAIPKISIKGEVEESLDNTAEVRSNLLVQSAQSNHSSKNKRKKAEGNNEVGSNMCPRKLFMAKKKDSRCENDGSSSDSSDSISTNSTVIFVPSQMSVMVLSDESLLTPSPPPAQSLPQASKPSQNMIPTQTETTKDNDNFPPFAPSPEQDDDFPPFAPSPGGDDDFPPFAPSPAK